MAATNLGREASPGFIGLISGGKDSLYSIAHCLRMGWELEALGNLEPARPDEKPSSDDIDSPLYQTIGHVCIGIFESILQVPLYRRQIIGQPLNQDISYQQAQQASGFDEVDDLLALLSHIKRSHPTAQYVCTGAVLSDYQRTRVEYVCQRLGLQSVAPLWQYPNLAVSRPGSTIQYGGLLQDMEEAGFEAHIIKIASAGLSERDLGKNVCSRTWLETTIPRMKRFCSSDEELNAALIGEGGEYETLCVRGPGHIWSGGIAFVDGGQETVSDTTGSAYLRILPAGVKWHQPISETESNSRGVSTRLRIPQLLGAAAVAVMRQLSSGLEHEKPERSSQKVRHEWDRAVEDIAWPQPSIQSTSHSLSINNLTARGDSFSNQVSALFIHLHALILEHKAPIRSIVQTTVCLRTMQDFPALNTAYTSLFTRPNPPTRICIASGAALPKSCHLMLHLQAVLLPEKPSAALHVQSRSHWAPANVGPYSQALTVTSHTSDDTAQGTVYLSGQIPLEPLTMALPSLAALTPYLSHGDDFLFDAALSAQHLLRVGRRMHVNHWASPVVYLSAARLRACEAEERLAERCTLAVKTWDGQCTAATTKSMGAFAVLVAELPLGASVEFHALSLIGPVREERAVYYEDQSAERAGDVGLAGGRGIGSLRVSMLEVEGKMLVHGTVCLRGSGEIYRALDGIVELVLRDGAKRGGSRGRARRSSIRVTVYAKGSTLQQTSERFDLRWIPCYQIVDAEGQERDVGFTIEVTFQQDESG